MESWYANNMLSAMEHADVVSQYVKAETEAKRFVCAGSSEEAQMLGIHCSPFGVIRKKKRPNKWRLIVN